MPSKQTVDPEETLRERLEHILPDITRRKTAPYWPPDVFALCAAILQSSGAYTAVVDDRQQFLGSGNSRKRAETIRKIARDWRINHAMQQSVPRAVQSWWKIVLASGPLPIRKINTSPRCTKALLNLLATADEACSGVGVLAKKVGHAAPIEKQQNYEFLCFTEIWLLLTQSVSHGATLCREVDSSRARVLPRMHTPQSGLTVRSLSHHLAYCPPCDIVPEWAFGMEEESKKHCFNLLIVPWPKKIEPIQFRNSKAISITDSVGEGGYGLFTYRLGKGPSLKHVKQLVREAEKRVGAIHGVVFPELAMSKAEYSRISNGIVNSERFIVAGVGKEASSEKACGRNEAVWDFAFRDEKRRIAKGRFEQKKHHRWKLTKSQIVQYGLGTSLHPDANWWEHISLSERSLAFLNVRDWLTCTVLICEDLARPDPVGDLLRAIGPNLVIALLSDGPQMLSRWPGRYAGALADDPGSSVLTVTSGGMSRLSKPADGTKSRSGVIALWRDPKTGAKEIEIGPEADALILNITAEYDQEWTADGRGDGNKSGYPVLSGYHQMTLTNGVGTMRRRQRSGK